VETTAHPPRVIGIDDWSWRKSQTYGTIIVDLERHTVIGHCHVWTVPV
jgi:transposase